MKEIKADIVFYKKTFAKVKNKFFIDNDPVEVVVDRIIEEYCLASCECEDDKWTSIQE
jgi:predicted nucleic acid-binding OB-fold protein